MDKTDSIRSRKINELRNESIVVEQELYDKQDYNLISDDNSEEYI